MKDEWAALNTSQATICEVDVVRHIELTLNHVGTYVSKLTSYHQKMCISLSRLLSHAARCIHQYIFHVWVTKLNKSSLFWWQMFLPYTLRGIHAVCYCVYDMHVSLQGRVTTTGISIERKFNPANKVPNV